MVSSNLITIILIIILFFIIVIPCKGSSRSQYMEHFNQHYNDNELKKAIEANNQLSSIEPDFTDVPPVNGYIPFETPDDDRYVYFLERNVYLLPFDYLDFSRPF